MSISLATYNSLTEVQKTTFFDNIELYLNELDFSIQSNRIAAKESLFNIFKNKSENNYLRKRAVESICRLTFLKIIRVGVTIDLLLDVMMDDDEFIQIVCIRNLFYFNFNDELEIIEKLKEYTFHQSGDVSSEAYFRLGQIYFFKANEEGYLQNLVESKTYFSKSFKEVENRIDAELFFYITEILLSADKRDEHVSKLASIIWSLTAFDFENKVDELYVAVYQCVCKIVLLENQNIDEFIDRSQFNGLCIIHYDIINVEISDWLKNLFVISLKDNLKREYLEPFYSQSFKTEKPRIKKLLDTSSTNEQKNLWNHILNLIEDDSIKKKDLVGIKSSIISMLPNESPENILNAIEELDINNPQVIIDFLKQYEVKDVLNSVTGSNVGDDIYKMIVKDIKACLPDYDKQRFFEFLIVLKDVIKYVKRSSEAERSDSNFEFLFQSNALEIDLQRSMLNMFKLASERGDYYSEENKEFADGGRIDIKYQVSNVTIPLELKRTFSIITEDRIKKDYLSQAQTYTYNRDQLGFFVLLDLVDKEIDKPMNDLRDLFGIIHLEPQHRVNKKHPDYIVWCIVPANKILPSQRSKYN